jgi:hypothetical protein
VTNQNPRKFVSRHLIAVLSGLVLIAAMAAPSAGANVSADPSLYSVAGESGSEVYLFGDAAFHGSLEEVELTSPVAGIAAHPTDGGYWLATADGTVYAFGAAEHHGDASTFELGGAIIDIAATPDGSGYWLIGSDGGVMSFGDASFQGSTGGIDLAAPIVAMTSTPSGNGYWLTAGDGGVFTFGDAGFYGSAGNLALSHPVTTIVSTGSGNGYWLFSTDGGVFSFGDARYLGGLAGQLDDEVLIDAAATNTGDGYLLAGNLGTVAAFGDAPDLGGLDGAADEPVAGIAMTPTGEGYWLATTPGGMSDGPPVPADSGSGRRIVYSNSGQRVWLIEHGEQVVTSYLVSGKKFTPRPGNYEVFSKSRHAYSHDGITMEYMVRFAWGKRLAIGFHSIPKYSNGVPMQTPEELGTYQSAGCVRQHVDQAEFLFGWADLGTKVIVLP